jgi:hypothetical protein
MDQVLLPFVIDQNTTHAVDGEEHIHIRSPGADGLDKRQYTMHIFSNAGCGDKADGYIDMIARGKGTRISRAEKQAWHEEVNVCWQKCAWVDRPVMLEIAKSFAAHVKEKHAGKPCVLFCDNLDAHCHNPVLVEFSNENIVVVFVPPGCTDAVQAIDVGIGRSIRIYVGHELDAWLEVEGNLERWENGLKAKERCILMTHWLAAANKKMVANDDLHEKCFEHTGMLLKLKAGPDDAKVKPQGLKLPYTIPAEVEAYPPAVPTVREENSSIDNVVDDGLANAAAASEDIVVDESEADPILDALLDCADVTGDQALLCRLWENVARSIRAS